MKTFNTDLVDYGIQNENSHIRAHVCPLVRRIYVYPTHCGLTAIGTGNWPKRPGYQAGISSPTALGYCVPPFAIPQCVALVVNDDVWNHLDFSVGADTTEKGRKAIVLVKGMLKNGMFPIPAIGQEIDDRQLQIDGSDIIVKAGALTEHDIVIQVKCDFSGGQKELGGTGNLYLQIAECNPFRQY